MTGRRPAPRPKRAGEEFARTHHLDGDGPSSSKKPRFDVRNPSALAPDAPEDDAVLELDEIGKGGQQTKRNAVNLDGYDSDSSTENFDTRADAKANRAKKNGRTEGRAEAEDENDMFADLEEDFNDGDEDEELSREGKKKKKDVRFLDEAEIEGQVANSKGGGHVSADFTLNKGKGKGREKDRDKDVESSSDSGDDEIRAEVAEGDVIDEELGAGGKKSHAPKLDAFNMKNEQEEGRFDAHGNFVRKAADPDAVHDSWLEGVSKKDMKIAKEAADKREDERRQKALADDQVLNSDILRTLILRMEKSETVLEALARLGKGKDKKPKWPSKNKNKRKHEDDMDIEVETAAEDPAEIKRRETVEAITGAADQLYTRGQQEIYDAEREVLMRQYRRETGEDWVDPPVAELPDEDANGDGESKQWEYRWSDARDGGEKHGPFDGSTMVAWNDAGYFGDGVEFQRVGEEGVWNHSVDFV
ncbi:MAG: hypothetical protein M1812_005097 [Candelaria pacifica]|nr:MAG: hypothetical protein M1812_005097 [Candelaria pacifica]